MPAIPKLRNTKPHIEQRIHRALEEDRKKRATEHAPGIMLSSVGKCPRALWAALHGIEEESPPEGRSLVIFELGNAIESHVIGLLRAAGFRVSDRSIETQKQHAISAYDGRLRGRLDGTIALGRDKFERDDLLEIKSAKVEKFEELLLVGYESWNEAYADTLHSYMGWGGFRYALVVVYCKNDSRLYCERIAFDPDRFARIQRKVEHVLKSAEPVAKPDDATSQYSSCCKYCPHNQWCWSPLPDYPFDK
jgi:CRISPR/Cas system-associated exonuclease Cas4 (RecB family)